MNPTADAIATIRAYVAGLPGAWSNTDDQVVAAANAATIANPAPQGAIPRPFTMGDVLGKLSAPSLQALRSFAGLEGLRSDVNGQALAACVEWCAYLPGAGVITPDEAAGILGVVEATIPDPSYQAQIGWARHTLGRPLDAADVATARAAQ